MLRKFVFQGYRGRQTETPKHDKRPSSSSRTGGSVGSTTRRSSSRGSGDRRGYRTVSATRQWSISPQLDTFMARRMAPTLCHASRFVGADSGPARQTGGRGCWCCKAWARSFHSWNGFAQVQTSRQSKSNTMQNFAGRFESMPLSKTTHARTRFDAEIIQQRAFLSQGKAQLRRPNKFACVP